MNYLINSQQCYVCQSEHIPEDIFFSCKHKLCVQCLCRTISINEIKQLENLNNIAFICPCTNGSSSIPIEQCLLLFKQYFNNGLSDWLISSNNVFNQTTHIKRKGSWIFSTQGDLDNYIQIIETKFRDKWSSELNLRLKQFDALNELLTQMRSNYIDRMNQQFSKAIALFSILKLVYKNFYNDLNKEERGNSSNPLLNLIIQKNKLDLKEIKFNLNNNHQNDDFDIIKDKLNSFYYHIKLAFDFNFKNKEILSTNVLNGHNESIFSLANLDNNRIASCSNDKLIKIWDMVKMVCVKVLEGHYGSVLALQFLFDSKLASGSGDKTIKIWDLDQMICVTTLFGHDSEIYSLTQLRDGKLVSGSGDKKIKIWNLVDNTCERTLTGHSRSIYALCPIEDHTLCSGSVDWKIAVWDLTNKNDNNVKVLAGHNGTINCLISLLDGRIASGSSDNTIKIWDIHCFSCEMTITGSKTGILSMIQLKDGRIVAGASENIHFFSILGQNLIQTVQGHSKNVNALIDCGNDVIVSGSGDKNILIWNLSR